MPFISLQRQPPIRVVCVGGKDARGCLRVENLEERVVSRRHCRPPSPADPDSSMIDNRIVMLKVGSERQMREFAIHEAILREHSRFFRTALDKKWREGRSRLIEMPQDEPDVVAAYVDWLYFKKIASRPISPPELPMDDGEYLLLAKMYAFGDKVQADAFCNAVIDAMALKTDDVASDGTRTFPSHSAIMVLYNGTPPGSPARRFVVDMYTEFGAEKWIAKESEYNHVEFLTDLIRSFLSRSQVSSIHKQSNYPRRREWYKGDHVEEFLQPAGLGDRSQIGEAE